MIFFTSPLKQHLPGQPISMLPSLPLLLVLLCLSGQVQSLPDSEADNEAANLTVTTLHNALLEIMQQADVLGYDGRVKIMQPVIATHFNSRRIAEVVLGRHWAGLDEAQQEGFVRLFQQLSTATYASRFAGYDGESFHINTTERAKRGRLRVKTELRRPGKPSVTLDYLLQPTHGQWQIINVTANGVSDLSLKRAEYTSVLKENGYNVLRDKLAAKVHALEENARTMTKPVE